MNKIHLLHKLSDPLQRYPRFLIWSSSNFLRLISAVLASIKKRIVTAFFSAPRYRVGQNSWSKISLHLCRLWNSSYHNRTWGQLFRDCLEEDLNFIEHDCLYKFIFSTPSASLWKRHRQIYLATLSSKTLRPSSRPSCTPLPRKFQQKFSLHYTI